VLVALAILAITTAFAFHALSGALDWTNRGTREESALLLAETIIGRVGRDIDLQPGEQDGRTEDGFVWHLRKTPYAGMAAIWPVGRQPTAVGIVVDVTVVWPEHRHARQVHLSTLRIAAGTGA
jgi:hypothetical protein